MLNYSIYQLTMFTFERNIRNTALNGQKIQTTYFIWPEQRSFFIFNGI